METPERATQLWTLLVFAAHNRQNLTFNFLCRLTDCEPFDLKKALETVLGYRLLHGLPPLEMLVTNNESGIPFLDAIRVDEIPAALRAVFDHDWLSETTPSPDDFVQAWEDLRSAGVEEIDV